MAPTPAKVLIPGSPKRLGELDALRGLAALAVVLFHYTTRYGELFGHTQPLAIDAWWGGYGVDLFFMLSGFVILMTLARTQSMSDFAVARFSRLYPAYWAAAAVTLAVVAFAGASALMVSPRDALLNVTMLQELLGAEHIDGAYWSLQVELLFYAGALVAWRFGMWRRPIRAVGIWLLAAVVVAGAMAVAGEGSLVARGLAKVQIIFTLRFIPLFAVGILLYDARKLGHFTPAHWLGVAAALAVHGLIDSAESMLIVALLAAALALAVFGRLQFLATRPLLFLGAISYPLYLIHENIGYVLIERTTAAGLNPHLAITLALGLALVLATLLSKAIEYPALGLIRRSWKSLKSRSAENRAIDSVPATA